MIIAPNSNAKLLTGVPIDSSYNHTVWFDSAAEQKAFFDGHVKSDVVTSTGQTFTFSLTGLTNQRVERNYISVNIPYALLLDINYVMFQNTMYDATKWFYGFVTNIEYVNTVTTNVYYEIDLIQTFLFDFRLQNVRVDRELVVDEGRRNPTTNMFDMSWGKYTVKESTPFKPNTQTDIIRYTLLGDGSMGTATNRDDDFFIVFSYQSTRGTLAPTYTIDVDESFNRYIRLTVSTKPASFTYSSASRTLTSSSFFVYNSSSALAGDKINDNYLASDVNTIINKLMSNDIEAVITSIQLIPKYLFSNLLTSGGVWNYEAITIKNFDYQIPSHFKNKSNSNYYTPNNSILYTSPYALINYSDFSQNEQKYLPEFVNNVSDIPSRTTIRLQTTSFIGQTPTILSYPVNYNIHSPNNYNYSFVFETEYEIPWSENYYNRWYAQNGERINSMRSVNSLTNTVGYLNSFVNVFGSAARDITNASLNKGQGVGNLFTDASNFLTDITSQYASEYASEQAILQEISVAENTIPNVKGSPSHVNALVPTTYYGLIFSYNTISGEECKIMDEYYSLYGYKLNVVKTPVLYDATELDCRKCWNYFKTSQCRLTRTENGANLNAADEEAIQAIFDRGITFWRNRDDVVIGDYSQDNPVVAKTS